MTMNLETLIETHRLKISGVIHMGGNTGEEIDIYHRCGIKRLIMFESLEGIIINKDLIPVSEAYSCALGNMHGEADLYLSQPTTISSSIKKPKLHLKYYPGIRFPQIRKVPVRRLDEFNTYGCNFLKMDVNGYEMEVFEGAENTLNWIDYIYTKVYYEELYEGCPNLNDIDNYLRSYERVETSYTKYGWGEALYLRVLDYAGNVINKSYYEQRPLHISSNMR
jgi:FkbM family methyltransferase